MAMKNQNHSSVEIAITAIGVAGVMLIMGGLIWLMNYYAQPEPVDQARWTERKRNLTELDAQAREQLANYGWQDPTRGVVRLPIERAMDLTIKEWQNPTDGHMAMVARLDKIAATQPVVTNAPTVTTNAPTTSTNAPAAKTNSPAATVPK
jgi:hypothetical protein